jgi:hypothetical protein
MKKGELAFAFSDVLAEWTGLAYILQAAETLASDSLRVPT